MSRSASAAEPVPRAGEFRVQLPSFEGPLDLLLHLIKKHELNILDLPVGFIAEKYQPLVDALYDGRESVHVEAQIKYEDGRTGTYSADLKIRDAKTFTPAAGKRAA